MHVFRGHLLKRSLLHGTSLILRFATAVCSYCHVPCSIASSGADMMVGLPYSAAANAV